MATAPSFKLTPASVSFYIALATVVFGGYQTVTYINNFNYRITTIEQGRLQTQADQDKQAQTLAAALATKDAHTEAVTQRLSDKVDVLVSTVASLTAVLKSKGMDLTLSQLSP